MTNLFDPSTSSEVLNRLDRLTPQSERQWGTMTAAQAVAHCSIGMQTATGTARPPRMLVGRILGPVIKRFALGNDEPMRKKSPTAPSFVVNDDRDLAQEKSRLAALIQEFSKGGPGCCTKHPHVFFGKLTPEQWSELMYKHVDHHLRQFGV